MRKWLAKLLVLALVAMPLAADAAAPTDGSLLGSTSAAAAAADADLLPVTQGGSIVKQTFSAIWTWIQTKIIPVGSGGTGIASGTSGGVLAFTGSTTIGSSVALTANLPVIGGGAGVAPGVGTRSGNTTAYVTTTGSQTSGDCVKIDASGNHIANGSACGGGASLSANNAWTAGQAVTPTVGGAQGAGGTLTPDFALSNSITATFGAGNLTIANPSGPKAGQPYIFALTQDATGGRTVTWGNQYKWPGGTAPTLSTGASAIDIVSCWASTTTTINCALTVQDAR